MSAPSTAMQKMGSSGGISEIVEWNEEFKSVHHSNRSKTLGIKSKADGDVKSHGQHVEDNLDRLLRVIDLRTSSRVLGPFRHDGVDLLQNSTLKKPVKVRISQASGIGISESATLKQALRRLCISQASEMAAMKRLSKPIGLSGVSEAGTIKRLYASVVVQASDSGLSLEEEKGSLVKISVVPEKAVMESFAKATDFCKTSNLEPSNRDASSSPLSAVLNTANVPKVRIQDVLKPTSLKTSKNPPVSTEIVKKGKTISVTSVSSSQKGTESSKSAVSPRLMKPVFQSKTCGKKKGKSESVSKSCSSSRYEVDKTGLAISGKTKSGCQKESVPLASSIDSAGAVVTEDIHSGSSKPDFSPNNASGGRAGGVKMSECSKSREKGECSQSSKSSIGDSSTSISEDSHQSGSSSNGGRPHMSKDVRWVAIRRIMMEEGSLGLKNFKLLKRLGCGDIGTVYLAELIGSEWLFALKVMDVEFLVSRKKMLRAQTEREILQMLDHPFLPTLYVHFTTDNLSCLVMEYCPGGDLHVLRQKQPGKLFSEPAARFYVAEVLLALEYLHMLGVIYRDLKPENILVRDDGHIMLSDFDLSLRCSVRPTLLRSSSLGTEGPVKKLSGPCAENSCIDPLCLQPSWVHVSCFTPRLVSSTRMKTHKLKADLGGQDSPLPQLVVEPTDARSNSFVGTHEYLAPEIIRGDGHGSAVDWWTFGIFLYELLFGRTPFKGPGNEETLANVVSQSLKFPENPAVSFHARDLIRVLLVKEPENRLGSVRGAAEIKQHPFFEGLNWALIRCAAPPETPRSYDVGTPVAMRKKKEGRCLDFRSNGDVVFELF